MCGHAGFFLKASKPDTRSQGKLSRVATTMDGFLANLGVTTQEKRGGDGYGWATYMAAPPKDKHEFMYYKDSSAFHTFNHANSSTINAATACLFHARYATVGGRGNEELNHPMLTDSLIFAHNGTIQSWESKLEKYVDNVKTFKSDTQALAQAITKHGIKDIVENVAGAMTLVWFNMSNHSLNFFKHAERHLYYFENDWLFAWSSEPWILLKALWMCGFTDHTAQLHQFDDNTHTSFNLKDGFKKTVETYNSAVEPPAPTRYYYNYDNYYGGKGYSNWNRNTAKAQNSSNVVDLTAKSTLKLLAGNTSTAPEPETVVKYLIPHTNKSAGDRVAITYHEMDTWLEGNRQHSVFTGTLETHNTQRALCVRADAHGLYMPASAYDASYLLEFYELINKLPVAKSQSTWQPTFRIDRYAKSTTVTGDEIVLNTKTFIPLISMCDWLTDEYYEGLIDALESLLRSHPSTNKVIKQDCLPALNGYTYGGYINDCLMCIDKFREFLAGSKKSTGFSLSRSVLHTIDGEQRRQYSVSGMPHFINKSTLKA